jgi:hypothetical protein
MLRFGNRNLEIVTRGCGRGVYSWCINLVQVGWVLHSRFFSVFGSVDNSPFVPGFVQVLYSAFKNACVQIYPCYNPLITTIHRTYYKDNYLYKGDLS